MVRSLLVLAVGMGHLSLDQDDRILLQGGRRRTCCRPSTLFGPENMTTKPMFKLSAQGFWPGLGNCKAGHQRAAQNASTDKKLCLHITSSACLKVAIRVDPRSVLLLTVS